MYGHLQIIKSPIYDLMIVKSYGHGDDIFNDSFIWLI